MKYKAIVSVMPLDEILDPQGKAVEQAIQHLGIDGVKDVRVGKQITFYIEAQEVNQAKTMVSEAAEKILANPIMESYLVEIEPC